MLTPKEHFIQLVTTLTVVPNARNATAVTQRAHSISALKLQILTPEIQALLGDDYAAVKTQVEGLA